MKAKSRVPLVKLKTANAVGHHHQQSRAINRKQTLSVICIIFIRANTGHKRVFVRLFTKYNIQNGSKFGPHLPAVAVAYFISSSFQNAYPHPIISYALRVYLFPFNRLSVSDKTYGQNTLATCKYTVGYDDDDDEPFMEHMESLKYDHWAGKTV
ncbi:hypothetical protein DERF_003516 [Dermatophagoides farinae]|uniref:Uncharacterized protein n=1 Tax=Dermatophagoides farinae TaxID=6954 RepID=A0A922LBK0_DERFA|nr:hypothetical protein DERF_003516 [Dermatophagoides farinae]